MQQGGDAQVLQGEVVESGSFAEHLGVTGYAGRDALREGEA